jgi:hypothetical protein
MVIPKEEGKKRNEKYFETIQKVKRFFFSSFKAFWKKNPQAYNSFPDGRILGIGF